MDTYVKKYKEALGWMQSLYNGLHGKTKEEAECYFPELKDEDEKIRKAIHIYLDWLDGRNKDYQPKGDYSIKDMIAWLEKQGERKPADKVEPRFKIGDWIVDKSGLAQQVLDFRAGIYTCTYNSFTIDCESNYHLWTIQDTKDGDVLCCESGWTCIFNTLNSDNISFSSYCFMDNTGWFCETGSESHTLEKTFIKAYNGNIYPATKEQCDLLFQKMHEAGYMWDSESKQLLSLKAEPSGEQKPAWSEEDELVIKDIEEAITNYWHGYTQNILLDWLKSLRQRIEGE